MPVSKAIHEHLTNILDKQAADFLEPLADEHGLDKAELMNLDLKAFARTKSRVTFR